MSKIAGEINAEMMHPKVIHEQRKALFAEMVRKTGSQQSVLDRLLQEIQFLREHLAAKEIAELREQVKMLREATIRSIERMCFAEPWSAAESDILFAQKALAATEQIILGDTEPTAGGAS